MRNFLGRDLRFQRLGRMRGGGGGAPVTPGDITIPISSSLWTAQEAGADADTRKTFATLTLPNQAEYIYGFYRGAVPEGNLSQIGTATWNATTSRYEWTSVGQASLGATVYNRVARRPADLSGPWEWITSPFDTKAWIASNVPSAPTGTWAALSTGSVRVTLAAWVGNGRAVTAGSYNRGAGATAFTPAAAGDPTIVDVTGLTDGVPTSTTFTFTNVNGTSSALTLMLEAEGAEAPPPSPDLSYLINGTGTEATVQLDMDEAAEYTGSEIVEFTYAIDGGTPVIVAGTGPLVLTGLDATQELTVSWANNGGYSDPVTIELIASPPTYEDGDWTLTDAEDAAGDVLIVAIGTPITVPAGLTLLANQYRIGSGAWANLPANGRISTGAPNTLASVRLRPLYSIGPAVPSDAKTATPTAPVAEPVRAAIFARGSGVGHTSTGSTGHTFANPAGSIAGHMVIHLIGFDGDPGTLTVASGSGWTLSSLTVASGGGHSAMTAWKILNGTGDTLGLTSSASEQSGHLSWTLSTFGEAPIFSAFNVATFGTPPDSPSLSFGGNLPFIVVTGTVYSQSDGLQNAGPTGYAEYRNQNSGGNASASIRVVGAERSVDGTSEDPGAWPVSVSVPTSVTIGFSPATSVAPTDTLSAAVSASDINNGESVTFTLQANGAAPIDYELTIEGVTYEQTAPTNLPVTFSVTPTTGSRAWTATATNAAGSDTKTGTITVRENLIYTINSADPFQLTVQADSVSHTVTAASYDLEWGRADGTGTDTLVSQTGPNIPLALPASGAWRFRVRAVDSGSTPGAWADWKYYFAVVQGGLTYTGENAAGVKVTALSPQAPVAIWPVTGQAVRMNEILPPVRYETWLGVVHTLNGVMYNPSAFQGRGPQGWDSRTGDGNDIRGLHDGFSSALVHTAWPQVCAVGDTFSKFLSRPSDQLRVRSRQGYRSGMADQHGGVVIMEADPGAAAAPSIIKPSAWSASPVALPGMSDIVDAFVASTLSISGMTMPNAGTVEGKVCRFDPSGMALRGGSYWKDDREAFQPYDVSPGSSGNYYAFETYSDAICMAASGAVTSDFKANVLSHLALMGIHQDHPGSNFRVGAGISLDHSLPLMLARVAQGRGFEDMVSSDPAVGQREIVPWMYNLWTEETLEYLNPHTSLTSPIFSQLKVPISITTTGTGHDIEVPFNLSNGTGGRKQSFTGLEIVRESTGQRLPWGAGEGRNYSGPTTIYRTIGFYDTTPTLSDRFYLAIPAAAMGAFAVGQPYWQFDANPDMSYNWNAFNPSPKLAYRDIPDPRALLIAGHLLGVYPTTPNWKGAKDYTIQTYNTWPISGFSYPRNGTAFTIAFFGAHATALGITL